MALPTMTTLSPKPDFTEVVQKLNKLIQDYNNTLLNLDSLNVISLTADHIDAGTIDAGIVTIRSDLTAGAYIQIDGNGMTVNNGTFDTFTVDINGNVTMTSATIQSQSGYPKVVMDPSSDLFGAYTSATNSIVVGAFDSGTGAPFLEWTNGSNNVMSYLTSGVLTFVTTNSDLEFQIAGDLDLRGDDNFLYANNFTHVPDWNQLKDDSSGNTLQDELDAKAAVGTSTSLSGSHNHGIPDGTVLMVDGGGTVTFVAVSSHSHTQQ